jgi:hypothetical protein
MEGGKVMKKEKNGVPDSVLPLLNVPLNLLGPTSDPLGSYTGRAVDPNEQPVQDADDL